MRRMRLGLAVVCWGLLAQGLAAQENLVPQDAGTVQAYARLQADAPGVRAAVTGARIDRLYGRPMAWGATAEEAAEQFRIDHAEVFGVPAADLAPVALEEGGQPAQPLMYEPATGAYKFTLVRYAQVRGGLPVFRANLRVLVRNEVDNPVVLAASSLRALGSFSAALPAWPVGFDPAQATGRVLDRVSTVQTVVWAGVGEELAKPVVAVSFIGERGLPAAGDYGKWLFVVDPATGTVLFEENQIIFTDVSGNVGGMATTGNKAEQCAAEVLTDMPYAQALITGGSSDYADLYGDFVIPNGGTSAVTVQSPMSGQYFTVDNVAGTEETLSQSVTPPGPADFVHNAANTSEAVRAQVNGYIQANIVRDFALAHNPSYPVIAGQTGFPVYVNRTDGYCPGNAWYDGSSLNFCSSSLPNYPNTAFSSVIHHEYGHHLVASGGSGQGAYGEGMSDCVAMLIAIDPGLGYGFYYGQCNTPLRNAANTYQYPCTGEIHDCGQLLSGCVWDTLQALIPSYPDDYMDIISGLTINSILLHDGDAITPTITVDFLTLDDNDGNIDNGTPHRAEICAGFDIHNMDCPALLTGLTVSPLAGFVSEGPHGGPFTPASAAYTVENLGPGAINYSVTASQPWISISNAAGALNAGQTAVVTISINAAAASLADGRYDDTVNFANTTDHVGDTTRAVTLNVGVATAVYEWPLDTNPGWTVDSQWAFGTPTGGSGDHGMPDPTSGHTGTNVYGYNLAGGYTDSMSERHLTSTAIDCTGLANVHLKFWRWLNVEGPAYDHAYVRVSTDGVNWTNVWQNSAEITDSSWVFMDLDIAALADDAPVVYLRWTMGSTDSGWTYSGWNIDDIQIVALGGAEPALTIGLPGGTPEAVPPAQVTDVDVQIIDGAEQYVPGTGLLYYRDGGGAFATSPLIHVSGNMYRAQLPPVWCGGVPEFYFAAQGNGGTTVFNPKNAPGTIYSAVVGTITTVLNDTLETNLGWTVGDTGDNATTGIWSRNVPQITSAQPGEDHTPAPGTQCWVTDYRAGSGDGTYDVDGGKTTVKTPTLNLAGAGRATISYWRWYDNSSGGGANDDTFLVDVTNNNGSSWVNVETVGPSGAGTSGGWLYHEFELTDLLPATALVKLRFVASDYNTLSLVEAAIDDFKVVTLTCSNPAGNGDFDGDGDVDLVDFGKLQECFGVSPLPGWCLPGDMNADAGVGLADYSLFHPALDASGPN